MNAPRSLPLLALALLLAGCPPGGGPSPVPPGDPGPGEQGAAPLDSPADGGEQGVTTGLLTPTAELLGPEAGWDAARVELREDRGLGGYTLVVLEGSGKGLRRQVEQYQTERRERLELDPARARELLRRFVSADARRFESIPGPPDGATLTLALRGSGGAWRATCAAGAPPPPAFLELAEACRQAAAAAAASETHAGPYEEAWELPESLQ